MQKTNGMRISKHKGNMAAVVIFSLLVVVLIVAMLSWTFAMQSTLQRRAERSTSQYTAVSCTTIMADAMMQDLCGMTTGKDQEILPTDISGYNQMLKSVQDYLFPSGSRYMITDPTLIVKKPGSNVLRTDVREELEKQLKGADLNVTLGGALLINESDSRNTLQYQGFDRAFLQPFTLDVSLKMGSYTVHQVYAVSDLAVVFERRDKGIYAKFDDSVMQRNMESQWIDTAEITVTEPN